MVEKSWKRRAKARGEMHSLRRLQVSCSPSSATGESGAVASFGQIGEIDTLRQSAKSAKGDEEREDQELQSADFAEVELRRVTELWGEGDVLISPLPCSLLFLSYISLLHRINLSPLCTTSMQAAEINAADLPPLPTRRGFARWYSQPVVQVCLIAMVCFLCPG